MESKDKIVNIVRENMRDLKIKKVFINESHINKATGNLYPSNYILWWAH